MKKPRNDRCRAAEKPQQQQTSHAKQAGPGNRKHCFFAQVDAAAESNEPAKLRNKRTVERSDGFANFATDKTFAFAGEQIVPVAP